MADTRISASLSSTDREAVMDAIATIKDKLPFLIDLTTEDRRTIVKMGVDACKRLDEILEVCQISSWQGEIRWFFSQHLSKGGLYSIRPPIFSFGFNHLV